MSDASAPPRTIGLPLSPESALARSRQITAIAEPTRLRMLSVVITDTVTAHTTASLAEDLDIAVEEAAAHLRVLVEADLLRVLDNTGVSSFSPTADAWVRFGRLVAPARINAGPPALVASSPLPPVIQRISDQLAYRFSTYFSRETVERYVSESYTLLADRSRVAVHLPSLTSRFASDRLGALATSQGLSMRGTPEVLFVCVQNAGRSQMAAALLRQIAGDRVHVRTAGSAPAPAVGDLVIEVLDEIGVPVGSEFPKPLTDEVVRAADFVITMGCGDACPVYPGRRYMDWAIPDPEGMSLEQLRVVRDDIEVRVTRLVSELGPLGPGL